MEHMTKVHILAQTNKRGRTEIIQGTFSNHNEIKLEISNVTRKSPNT